MRIYRMTATFGKLEHATITLKPGLNIIEAPNEWGKSTWCAFLVNMLYGLDTRARSTSTVLADKDRYVPWSGSPMSGRIDLCWNDRDITIERSSKGRIVFGNFRAYETETGIEVPELNGVNCGQMLLGVERSVFLRAGFLKQSDLPVTQDDSLRRRLNNLVTTGDESDASDTLAQQLRDLKNRCRYNRTGLLPQAETERDQTSHQLTTLHDLQNQIQSLQSQQATLQSSIEALENHAAKLQYAETLENAQKVVQAEDELLCAKQRLAECIHDCESLPPQETLDAHLLDAAKLQEQWIAVQTEYQMLPPVPPEPAIPPQFQGISPQDAVGAAQRDELEYQHASGMLSAVHCSMRYLLIFWFLLSALLLGLSIAFVKNLIIPVAIVATITGIVILVYHLHRIKVYRRFMNAFEQRYGSSDVTGWVRSAKIYAQSHQQYLSLLNSAEQSRRDLEQRASLLQQQILSLTKGAPLSETILHWTQTRNKWDALADARRQLQQAQAHLQTLQGMVTAVEPPEKPDALTYDAVQTQRILAESRLRLQQIHLQLGQCQGQIDAIGSEAQLRARLDTLNLRIARLEDTYYALEMALDAQREATMRLQRRFAPMISKRAQTLFSHLTGGRYQRLNLGSDLNIHSSAEGEDTLHPIQWRSDGTADQQYLALRLAIAEELTPHAPLILDDALVRFDDQRLGLAMEIFREISQNKQIILFTCQSRESNYITEE